MRWRILKAIAVALLVALGAQLQPLLAADCDEANPLSPARSANIVLSTADMTDDGRRELRTFVETGSLGNVVASIASQSPRGVVRHFVAVPHISRMGPDYGEQLRGINISAELSPGRGSARIVVKLRQVCAQRFRDTFLYE